VTGHGESVNARSEQAPQAALQWADGLEEAVGLIYQVAAEGDDIDALSQRRLDDGIPGGGTAVRRAVERIRQLAGATSDVQVSGAQELHGPVTPDPKSGPCMETEVAQSAILPSDTRGCRVTTCSLASHCRMSVHVKAARKTPEDERIPVFGPDASGRSAAQPGALVPSRPRLSRRTPAIGEA